MKMEFNDPGTCVGFAATNRSVVPTEEEIAALKDELTASVDEGFLTMQIDKTNLGTTSNGHALIVEYESLILGTIRIQLGSPFEQVGPVTVTKDGDKFVFTGPVVVWDVARSVKEEAIIFCPGGETDPNKVVATVN